MKWLKSTPIAHRGLHSGLEIPENSMKAFDEAIKKGYSIELDVRLSKDNKVVVFHDLTLTRLCSKDDTVHNKTAKELVNFELYNSKEKIPLLSDVLKYINGQVAVIVEIKNYASVGVFEKQIVKELENYKGEFAICSFNPKVVRWFRKNRPDFNRGLVCGDVKKYGIWFYKFTFLRYFIRTKPHFISLDYELINTFIPKFCRKMQLPIVVWTVNSNEKKQKVRGLTDNIIFENIKP